MVCRYGWGTSVLERWIPNLVPRLGRVFVDLGGAGARAIFFSHGVFVCVISVVHGCAGALASLRIFNPVGDITVQRGHVGQLTLDTSLGHGAVQLNRLSAGCVSI